MIYVIVVVALIVAALVGYFAGVSQELDVFEHGFDEGYKAGRQSIIHHPSIRTKHISLPSE